VRSAHTPTATPGIPSSVAFSWTKSDNIWPSLHDLNTIQVELYARLEQCASISCTVFK
jgi:hypothetical protein